MTRHQIEETIRAIIGRELSDAQIDAIIKAAAAYNGIHDPQAPGRGLRHTSETDLYPLISVLADALLNERKPARHDPGDRAPVQIQIHRYAGDPAEAHELAQMLGFEPTPVQRSRDRRPRRGAA